MQNNRADVNSECSDSMVLNDELMKWAAEEYKLLNSHYFHEDNFFLKCTAHFMTLNTGIVTIYGSQSLIKLEEKVVFALLLIGLAATITWILTLFRVRHVKVGVEDRIAEIESDLNKYWDQINYPYKIKLLRIRNNRPKGGKLNMISSTYIMSILPLLFSSVWIYLIVGKLLGFIGT